jgi:hypothetical protein
MPELTTVGEPSDHAQERPKLAPFFCWSPPPRDSMLIVVGSGARNEYPDRTRGTVSMNPNVGCEFELSGAL